MRKTLIAATAAAVLLAGCSKSGPPPKPQPGSWSMKMELLDATGPGADMVKGIMGASLAAANSKSICITPEASAKSDPVKGITNNNGDCKFDKQEVTAGGIHLSATCNKNGATSKVVADGMLTETSQDMTIQTETASPMGNGTLNMKLHMALQRTGDCKPGDITPPADGTGGGTTM